MWTNSIFYSKLNLKKIVIIFFVNGAIIRTITLKQSLQNFLKIMKTFFLFDIDGLMAHEYMTNTYHVVTTEKTLNFMIHIIIIKIKLLYSIYVSIDKIKIL